jgi:predicted ATP-dependent endonuclease of OLD family
MIYHFVAEQTEAGLDFDINLDKDKRVYCFIGDNAVGKTNLLENMARALLYCHSLFKSSKQNTQKYSGIFFNKIINDAINKFSLRLAAGLSLNQTKIKDKIKDNWDFTGFENLAIRHPNVTIDKPLVFIGAKNRGYTKNIDTNQITILGNKYKIFSDAFIRSFNYMNGKSVEKRINPNFVPQDQSRISEVINVFELMQKLEPSLNLITEKDGALSLNIKFDEGKLYIGSVPIDKLSTGFVSIIKLFQEIIAAYGGWTSVTDEKDLSNVEGMVFIDEIESHIHPKWQYRIISLLKESFPMTTFYIATHSPVIISTTDEGEAYQLVRDGKKVTAHQLGNPKEWYLADVFAQAFHVDFTNSTVDDGSRSLIHQLKDFSTKVKDYVNNQDENLKTEAEMLYQKILPSLAKDDPRRRSLDSLRSLLG